MRVVDAIRRRVEWYEQARRFRFAYEDPSERLILWSRWAEREYGAGSRLSRQAILFGLRHVMQGGIGQWMKSRRKRTVRRRSSPRARTAGYAWTSTSEREVPRI